MMFNRMTLPAYYGLLRMCCQQSRAFTRQLAQHQNILWAFKNITPYPGQYPGVSGLTSCHNILIYTLLVGGKLGDLSLLLVGLSICL